MNQVGLLKWYKFDQNNSGGSFDEDKKVCPRVFIQALSAEDANQKAESLGIYFNGVEEGQDCECCGDRWYPVDDSLDFPLPWADGLSFENVEEYAYFLARNYGWGKVKCRLFYADGLIKEIK